MRQRLEEAKRNIAKPTEGANIDVRHGGDLLYVLLDYDSFDEDAFRQWLVDVGYDKYGIKEKVQKEWGSLDVVDATPENISNMMSSQMADDETYEKFFKIKALHGLKDIKENSEDLREDKDIYYESKFTRLVRFDEIPAAVIPNDTPHDIRNFLAENGVQIYEYNPEEDNAKARKVREVAEDLDLRFRTGETYDRKKYPIGRVEARLNQKRVNVVDVPQHQHEGTLKDALRNAKQWAKENIVGTLSNEETGGKGMIEISGNAVEKFLSNSALEKSSNIGVHISALHKLPEIIRESIFVESHPDFKKVDGKRRPENGIASNDIIHRLYGAITINGNLFRVKTTIRELSTEKGRNITHSYEVTKVELIDVSSATPQEKSGQHLKRPINSISAAKLLKNVRISYAEAGKDASEAEFLLDESRKRDEKEAEQTTVAETTKTVAAELQDKFGTEAEVIESLDDVQDAEARKRIAAGEAVKGWYDPKTGKVYLYAPNIESEQDAMATYAHEVIAHKGMEGLLGKERYAELCKRLGEALTPEQRKLVKEYAGSSRRTLGDEYIARIAEMLIDENGNIKEPTTWEKVKGVVREFFRDVCGLNLTDADIRYMLWQSAERLRRDGGDLFQRAQDITTGQHLRWQAETQRAMRFRFIGENGAARADQSEEATIRMDNLQVAQEMETEGKDAKNIKLATGWERGADGLWRYEENDEEIKQLIDNFFAKEEDNERKRKALFEERQRRLDEYIKASKSLRKYWREKSIKTGEYTRWGEEVILTPLEKLDKDLWNTNNELDRLADEIRYGEVKDYLPANSLLLAEYPELGSVKFDFVSYLDEGVDGQYSKGPWPGDQGAINLRRGLSKSESYRTLTHEVQHAIQQIEGFAVGSNPKAERSFERYNKISGEVEARNASRRMDMSDEQRRSSLAIDTEDVARNDQVVSFGRRENPLMTESEQDEALSRVNDAFNTQLRSFAPETADKAIFKLGRPSDILIAAGVVDKEMKLYGSKLLKKIREHGFALSEIKDLPLSIASPIAVFDNHRSGSNRAILTELRAVDGNILVTIEVGKGGDVDFNIVSSVFGKRGNSVVNWINKGHATYIDKEKALSYLHLSAPIAEATESQELTHATKVIQEFENPNTNRQNSDGNALFRSDPLAAIIGDDFVRASQAKAQTTVAETVNAVTADLQDKFGIEAEVIGDLGSVPDEQARKLIAAGENVKGWYDPKTGKAYLYAPNIEGKQDAMATYAHEVIAHKGMAGPQHKRKSPVACGEVVGDFVCTRSGYYTPKTKGNQWILRQM